MNAQSIHKAVLLGLRSGDAALYNNVQSNEIDFEFNRAVLNVITRKFFPRGNKHGKGYEDTFVRDAELKDLETPYSAVPHIIDATKVGIALPPDFLYYISSESEIWYNRCSSLTETTTTTDEYVVKLPFNSSFLYTTDSIKAYNQFDILKASTTRTAFADDADVVNDSDEVTITAHGYSNPYFFVKFHGVTYFVTDIPGVNTITLDRVYEGATETIAASDADTGNYGTLSIISTVMKNKFQYYVYPTDETNFVTDMITDVSDNYSGNEELYWEDYKTVSETKNFLITSSTDPEIFAIKYDNDTYTPVTSEALSTDRISSVTGSSGTRRSNNRLLNKKYIRTLLNNPHRKSRVDSPAGNIERGLLVIYRVGSLAVKTVYLEYLKRPKQLALKTGTVPELGDNLLKETIAETVNNLLERYSSQRFQSHTVITNKSE